MKKKLTVFIIAMLCLMMVVAGTLAYYTQSVTTHNVISSGNVKVDLIEYGEGGEEHDKIELEGVMPGQHVAKVVTARNVGTGDAWVRMKLEMRVEPAEGLEAELDESDVSFEVNSNYWVKQGDWYYYNAVLFTGAESEPIISTVEFNGEDMGNEWQNAKVIIDVFMEATQRANNPEDPAGTVFDAQGWPNKY